jgi:precorrin-8X/cobalt-precorrin-8 methylmutase
MIKYEKNPKNIQKNSIQAIQKNTDLSHFSNTEKEVATQMLIAAGDASLSDQLRFSNGAIESALEALDEDYDLLCDTENVACAMKQKYLTDEPICVINKASVISQAKSSAHTRSMEAVNLWKPYLSESFVVIGREPTALYHLIELLTKIKEKDSHKKPSLIIATPAGFANVCESKEYLWERHQELDVPCITLLGNRGGSDVAAAAMNTLLKMHQEKSQLKSS